MSTPIIICIIIVLIILFAIIISLFRSGNKNQVMKSEVIENELLKKANTPTTNLYSIYVKDRKKPIELSIPKQYKVENDMIITYKMISGKPRFILLEEVIKKDEE